MEILLLWLLAGLLVTAGVAGVIVPALPGAPLVFAGLLLAAWIDDFQRISIATMVLLGVLTAASWALDIMAAGLGAKRVGASPLAVAGALIGTLLGIFGGLLGLLFFPLLGAAIGEYLAKGDAGRATEVGIATWIGLLIATALKLALVCSMLGVFALAWLID